MVDDNIQASAPSVPAFGQPANSLPISNLQFGTPVAPSGGPSVFQFGSNQDSTVPQTHFNRLEVSSFLLEEEAFH